ncbi:hypothetical protein ACXJJ3_32880 [Kribbella sp. WER1]
MSTYNLIETRTERGTQEATVRVEYTDPAHALTALNQAYAEARALLESRVPTQTVAPTNRPGPLVLIDRDDDRWEEQPSGVFFMRSRSGALHFDPYSRDAIERKWGPVREVRQ